MTSSQTSFHKPWCRALLLTSLLAQALPALAADPACTDPQRQLPATLTLKAGMQEPITLAAQMTRMAVGEPAVADVGVVDGRTLLLQGRKTGETSLLVWTQCSKDPQRATVRVLPVLEATQTLISPSLPPQSEPAAREALNKLPSQVQADIRFVEVSRSRLQELGTRFAFRSGHRSNIFSSPGFTGTVTSGSPAPGIAMSANTDTFNIIWGGNSSRFLAAIDLLEQNGYAYTLSKPSLVALSGQSANFLAGGEVPIPIPQGQNGAVGIEYKEFGVRLTISPTVLDAQQILLKVAPEVSDLDFANAVTIQGSVIPALRIRRTDTSISLADGESFIISGLVSRSTLSNVDKLPGLGSIPILGAFFRSTRFESEDRELLMIVTPRLVKPLRANAELPPLPGNRWQRYQPSNASLFWKGVTAPLNESTLPAGR